MMIEVLVLRSGRPSKGLLNLRPHAGSPQLEQHLLVGGTLKPVDNRLGNIGANTLNMVIFLLPVKEK